MHWNTQLGGVAWRGVVLWVQNGRERRSDSPAAPT